MKALITVRFIIPMGYQPGDYALLHGNGGSGEIDWESPLSQQIYDLFPNGSGIYGFALAPFGGFRFGEPAPMRVPGFGYIDFGLAPFGLSTAVVEARCEVSACGDYKFGLACYDELGNAHEGTPEEAEVEVHIAPDAPTGLIKSSYDKETDVLILDAAD